MFSSTAGAVTGCRCQPSGRCPARFPVLTGKGMGPLPGRCSLSPGVGEDAASPASPDTRGSVPPTGPPNTSGGPFTRKSVSAPAVRRACPLPLLPPPAAVPVNVTVTDAGPAAGAGAGGHAPASRSARVCGQQGDTEQGGARHAAPLRGFGRRFL